MSFVEYFVSNFVELLDQTDESNRTPLFIACLNGHYGKIQTQK